VRRRVALKVLRAELGTAQVRRVSPPSARRWLAWTIPASRAVLDAV
jgi:hypothetical protein